jgi:hypothetical protein
MSKEIKLIKNNDKKDLSDVEWMQEFNYYLKDKLKLSASKAFSIIYYLQEHLPVFPDHIEKCSNCDNLYDSYSQGHHSELTDKFYCSESCEPAGLYEREQRWEKRKDAPFQKWKKLIKKEQDNYPFLKDKEISDGHLRRYFDGGSTPIDTLNDILTLVTHSNYNQ